MNEYDKLCDALIEKAAGEKQCKRFQERIELGSGGIQARLFPISRQDDADTLEKEFFGHSVVLRDISRSGVGLVSFEELDLNSVCLLRVVDLRALKGTLVYKKDEGQGKGRIRYGFSLDEWLPDDVHQKLSL